MYSKLNSPFAWILTFFILLFIYAKIVGPIPFSLNSITTQKSTTFDVTGEGKVTVKPDIVLITVGIQANGSTVKIVQEQINSAINRVSGAIKDLGVDPKDIQTRNYNINPEYDYSGSNQKIKGYTASTNLSIKVRQIDKVNQVIDVATSNGANQVGGISFEVDDRIKAENEARKKAVDEAKNKAQNAAKIAGFRLGKIINYSENFPGSPRPVYMLNAQDTKSVGGTPTQVEPGSTDISVIVTLSFELQ